MSEELVHQVALCLTPGIGNRTLRKLISYCGSASRVFQTSSGKLKNVPGLGPKTIAAIHQESGLRAARREISRASQLNVKLIFYTSPHFPKSLHKLEDAPLLLYIKGHCLWGERPTLGIVGTRRVTAYGRAVLEDFIQYWSRFNPVIVSGMAYGVDIAAHRGALQNGLRTVGVLGNSLDSLYPGVHRATAEKMIEDGALISELKFGTKPDAFQFPKRNRIIAGLCDALVIVEARESGGALITAEFSRKYRRKVFAIPGPVNSEASAGCLKLIRQGTAQMLCHPQELAQQLHWKEHKVKYGTVSPVPAENPSKIGEIIEVLREKPAGMHIDEISWKARIPINQTGSILLDMEFDGIVKCLPGKKFSLIRK